MTIQMASTAVHQFRQVNVAQDSHHDVAISLAGVGTLLRSNGSQYGQPPTGFYADQNHTAPKINKLKVELYMY